MTLERIFWLKATGDFYQLKVSHITNLDCYVNCNKRNQMANVQKTYSEHIWRTDVPDMIKKKKSLWDERLVII